MRFSVNIPPDWAQFGLDGGAIALRLVPDQAADTTYIDLLSGMITIIAEDLQTIAEVFQPDAKISVTISPLADQTLTAVFASTCAARDLPQLCVQAIAVMGISLDDAPLFESIAYATGRAASTDPLLRSDTPIRFATDAGEELGADDLAAQAGQRMALALPATYQPKRHQAALETALLALSSLGELSAFAPVTRQSAEASFAIVTPMILASDDGAHSFATLAPCAGLLSEAEALLRVTEAALGQRIDAPVILFGDHDG